ncbi:MAG: aminotransferase class IV [Bacteroidales bacterium]|nr:aminotransferase class IV [Bacteroidales bacterium]
MCLLLETIKVLNKEFNNIELHNERFNKSRKDLFDCGDFINIKKNISIPENLDSGLYRCRVLYKKEIEKTEFIHYKPKKIKTLKIVECNEIEYSYKFADRIIFENLKNKYPDFDEILIVKNNFITDTSFSNIVFFDGGKWLTPSTPLLKGTKREDLLRKKLIFEEQIKPGDLNKFKKACLINAMLDIDENDFISIEGICF